MFEGLGLSTAPHRLLKKREITRAVELLETLVGGEGVRRLHVSDDPI
jgi:hypothetical protein